MKREYMCNKYIGKNELRVKREKQNISEGRNMMKLKPERRERVKGAENN